MDKKYNYQEFKNDPRTFNSDKTHPRYIIALFDCIDNKRTSPQEIFEAIDKAYSIGKHRNPSYIKYCKSISIKLLDSFNF